MPVAATIHDALASAGVAARVRVEILDAAGTLLLDLSDKITQDRVQNLPGLKASMERDAGATQVELGSITFDNSDRYFDKLPPATVGSWYRKRVRVSLITQAGVTSLGIFLIDDEPQTSTDSNTATFPLKSLEQLLIDAEADSVKDGRSWYANRPLGWLLRELLRTRFTDAEVRSWEQAQPPTLLGRYKIPLADTTQRALSHYGRPPEWDGTIWQQDGQQIIGSPMLYVTDTANATLYGRVLVGIGTEVWAWYPDTDTWTKVGALAAPYATTHRVMQLRWSVYTHEFIAIAWQPLPVATSRPLAADRGGCKGQSNPAANVLFYHGSGGGSMTLFNLPSFGPPNGDTQQIVWTGHFCLRAGRTYTPAGANIIRTVGRDPWNRSTGGGGADQAASGYNVPLPFSQYVASAVDFPVGGGAPLFARQTGYGSATGSNPALPPWWSTEPAEFLSYGDSSLAQTNALAALDYRFSIGQKAGCFLVDPTGLFLWFFTVRWDTTAQRYYFRYWRLDLATGAYDSLVQAGYPLDYDAGLTGYSDHSGLQPYAFALHPDGQHFYVCAAVWNEKVWSGGAPSSDACFGVVTEHTLTNPANALTVFDSSAFVYFGYIGTFLPIESFCVAGNWLVIVMYDAKQVGAQTTYGVFVMQRTPNGPQGSWSGQQIRWSRGRPGGLAYDAGTGRVYWHESESNVVVSAALALTGTPTVEDDAFAPVDADQSLLAGLVYDPRNAALYGISGAGSGSQADPQTQQSPLPALNLLWQFADFLTDRMELADYHELNVWDGLQEMKATGDFSMRFDRLGRFSFLARASGAALATIRVRGAALNDVLLLARLERLGTMSEIANIAEIVPSAAVMKAPGGYTRSAPRPNPPTVTVGTGSGTGFDTRQTANVTPIQSNTKTLTVTLQCSRGGSAGDPAPGLMAQHWNGKTLVDVVSDAATQELHRLRFRYRLQEVVIETQLLNQVSWDAVNGWSASLQVPYPAGKSFRAGGAGDRVRIAVLDATGNPYEKDFLTGSVVLQSTAGRVLLGLSTDADRTTVLPAGTHVTLHVGSDQKWSDHPDGLTILFGHLLATGQRTLGGTGLPNTDAQGAIRLATFDSTDGLYTNCVLETNTEQLLVTSVVTGTTGNVQRGYNGTPVATQAAGTAARILTLKVYDGSQVGARCVVRADQEEIRLTERLAGDRDVYYATRGVGGTLMADHVQTTPILAFVAPIQNALGYAIGSLSNPNGYGAGVAFDVGGSGVALRIDLPAVEGPWFLGDEIVVDCPGLSLLEQPLSKRPSEHADSIARFGRRPFPAARKFRFLNQRQAYEVGKRIVRDYAMPHVLLKAEGPLKRLPDVGDVYLVQDPLFLPSPASGASPNGNTPPVAPDTTTAIAMAVRAYEINPLTGTLQMTLRAVNPRTW